MKQLLEKNPDAAARLEAKLQKAQKRFDDDKLEEIFPLHLRLKIENQIRQIAKQVDPENRAKFPASHQMNKHILLNLTPDGILLAILPDGLKGAKAESKEVDCEEIEKTRHMILGVIAGAGMSKHRRSLTTVPKLDSQGVTFGSINDLILSLNALAVRQEQHIDLLQAESAKSSSPGL